MRVRDLKVGEEVIATVIDVPDAKELLLRLNLNFESIRVVNETQTRPALGSKVRLRIVAVSPLRFQLLPDRPGHLDVSI